MPSVVFRRPRDLLKILLPFSRPARRRRCSSGGNALSSQQISLQQPLYFFRTYWTLNKKAGGSHHFLQLVWLSHGAPHWWQCAIISSEIRSPIRSSKNKIFANKTHRQALLARLTGVFNNSALDMPDFVESVMFHPGTGFFHNECRRCST